MRDGAPAIILRHTCDSIGIGYESQFNRLKRQAWATVFMMNMVADDGKVREMVVIDRRTFAMWLATVDTSRLTNQAVAAKVRLYQCEAADVLDRHFFGAPTPTAAPGAGTDHALWQARQFVSILERQADLERRLAALEAGVADARSAGRRRSGSPGPEMASPIAAFLRERCEVGEGFEVRTGELHTEWTRWCLENSRSRSGPPTAFGRRLRAVLTDLETFPKRYNGYPTRFFRGVRLKAVPAR